MGKVYKFLLYPQIKQGVKIKIIYNIRYTPVNNRVKT